MQQSIPNLNYFHLLRVLLIMDLKLWLENTVIQQAHVLLKKINPDIQGFQQTSLDPFSNFDQVCEDFVQILHTGGNHWVCASSIGCEKDVVNLYDRFFYDGIP